MAATRPTPVAWAMAISVFLAAFFWSGTGIAQDATADSSPDARLRAEIARIAGSAEGTVGVAAIDLSSGAMFEYNADERFQMASTLKLPLAAYAFHLADSGRLSLAETHPMTREAMLEPGILYDHFRHPGLALSTLNAIELSITRSDNGATDFVYARVGGPAAVNAWLARQGFSDINMGSMTVAETFAGENAPADPFERTATPRSVARFLAALHRGELLDPANLAAFMDILSRTAGERISLHLPPGTEVLHKTGTLFSSQGLSVNDIGYMRTPEGRVFAIALFIKNSPESVSHGTRDAVIGHISRSIYDHFLLRADRSGQQD